MAQERLKCTILVLIYMTGGARLSSQSMEWQSRHLEETHCRLPELVLTPEKAFLGHHRRKHATIVLSTDISGGQGLTNQHINMVSLITLALVAKVDRIILPRYKHRSHFSLGATWQETNAEILWDVENIRDFLQARGIDVQVSSLNFNQGKACSGYLHNDH